MKIFTHIVEGEFIRRLNRFAVECQVDGRLITAHLPNPGRLWEILLPGTILYLERHAPSDSRKTLYTIVASKKGKDAIFLHTHQTNTVAEWLIMERKIPGLEEFSIVKREFSNGNSRFDFLLENGNQQLVLEVKSCTLFGRLIAMFPDAMTVRGRKHLMELSKLKGRHMKGAVLFLVHSRSITHFMPEYHTDLEFAKTLIHLRNKVTILPLAIGWNCDLEPQFPVKKLTVPWNLLNRECHDSGSYILVLKLERDRVIHVGGLGKTMFNKGFYLYAGSGKKNLIKRMERHKNKRKKLFWHIDYLREYADFHAVLPIRSSEPLECRIARSLKGLSHWTVGGFGCSDCSCDSHLFAMSSDPLKSQEVIELLIDYRINRLNNMI